MHAVFLEMRIKTSRDDHRSRSRRVAADGSTKRASVAPARRCGGPDSIGPSGQLPDSGSGLFVEFVSCLLSYARSSRGLANTPLATAGSLIGGFLTYRLARKGGKEALQHWFRRQKKDRVNNSFRR